MGVFAISPLISALLVLFLGIFVFWKNRKIKLNKIFLLFTFSVAVWFFGTFMMLISKSDEKAIFWDRFVYGGVVFIPVIGYHFSLTLAKRKTKNWLLLGYFLSFIFLILSRTNYFIEELYKYSWGVHTQARVLHHVFLVFFSFYSFLFFLTTFRHYIRSVGVERIKAKYILLGIGVLTTGAIAFLPAYGINVYPVTYFSGVGCVVILTYAIIKYRLMDIRVVMGKGAIYVFSFLSVIGVAFLLIFLNNQLAQPIPFYFSGYSKN